MTPIALTKPATITSAASPTAPDLAMQPLEFTEQRHCTNKSVMAAITDALSDKSRADHCIAAILKNAYLHHYQTELNQIILNLELRHGAGTVLINHNVQRILWEHQIDLLQNSDGSVARGQFVATVPNPERHRLINLTGTDLSGANLTHANLVRAHISQANLTGVNLSHADLSAAVFEYVELRSNPVLTETNWHEVRAKSITVDSGTRLQLPLQIARRCVEPDAPGHFDR